MSVRSGEGAMLPGSNPAAQNQGVACDGMGDADGGSAAPKVITLRRPAAGSHPTSCRYPSEDFWLLLERRLSAGPAAGIGIVFDIYADRSCTNHWMDGWMAYQRPYLRHPLH
jgi:hypothetical protein